VLGTYHGSDHGSKQAHQPLGDWIQAKRKEKNLARCHLAEKMGIGICTVLKRLPLVVGNGTKDH
jgi:hypothetical protein